MVRAGFHGRRGCLCVWLELRRRIGSGGGGARCLQSIESPPLTRRGGLAEGSREVREGGEASDEIAQATGQVLGRMSDCS